MTPPEPIRIAGAGPSGLSAAITLARAGRAVEVHEAKPDVGVRFIGDHQVIENASEAETVPELLARIGIEVNFDFRPGTWATFYDPRGRGRRVESRTPYGYFIRRGPEPGTLDRGLLAQARALGVDVRFNSRLRMEDAGIVATGPASPDGLAKEITFRSTLPDTVDVYFDHHLSPGGYSYLFVLDGVATFGCAIVSGFKQIDAYFDRSLERAQKIHPFDVSDGYRAGYSYMNFHLKRSSVSGPASFVGEAAGFQDYLFGLGIRYALTTGHLAARAILEQRSYDELWQAWLGPKQRTSVVNRFLYEVGGNTGLSTFTWMAAHAGDFRKFLSGWHRYPRWKAILLPLIQRAWKQQGRCLHKPGEHWCRARDTEMKVPALGEVKKSEE